MSTILNANGVIQNHNPYINVRHPNIKSLFPGLAVGLSPEGAVMYSSIYVLSFKAVTSTERA